MILVICLTGSLLGWLLCARADYRIAVRREWLTAGIYESGNNMPSECPDYYRAWHSAYRCHHRCATWSREDFAASRRNRTLLALTGPLLLLAILPWIIVTGRQPLSASEREHRLKQAEEDLARATVALNQPGASGNENSI